MLVAAAAGVLEIAQVIEAENAWGAQEACTRDTQNAAGDPMTTGAANFFHVCHADCVAVRTFDDVGFLLV